MKKLVIFLWLIVGSLLCEGQMIIKANANYVAPVASDPYGPEMITCNDFSCATNWAGISGWVIGSGVATSNHAEYPTMLNTNAPCVSGHIYHFTYNITSYTGGIFYVICEGGARGEFRTSAGTFTDDIIATGSGWVYWAGGTEDDTFVIDNVSMKEIL
jgi:hypothetical protein